MIIGMRRPAVSWRNLVLSLLGIALFVGMLYVSGVDNLPAVLHPDPVISLMTGGAIALQLFMFSERWRTITNGLVESNSATAFDQYFYALSSRAMGQFLPQTASIVVVRSTMLNQFHGIPLQKGIVSVLFDKLYDLFMVILLVGPVLLLISGMASTAQAFAISLIGVGIVSVIIIMRYDWWLRGMLGLVRLVRAMIRRMPFLRRVNYVEKLDQLDNLAQWKLLRHPTVLRAYGLTIVGQLLMVLRTWLIAQAIGVDISGATAFLAVALAQGSILIAITPGSLGMMEASWYAVLEVNNVPSEDIAAFMVAHRIFTIISLAVSWLVVYAIAMIRARH